MNTDEIEKIAKTLTDIAYGHPKEVREYFEGRVAFSIRQAISESTSAQTAEIAELKRICGDRYPDARALDEIHKLRAEIVKLRQEIEGLKGNYK